MSDHTKDRGDVSALIPFHIFLASPGDVSAERRLAREVIDRLRSERRFRDRVSIQVVAWDQPGASVAMEATLTPQQAIARGLRQPCHCDLVVVILWSRIGAPLPDDYRNADGQRYRSGTEWEYCNALDAYQIHGQPSIWVYHRTQAPTIALDDVSFQEKRDQLDAVRSFLTGLKNPDGSLAGGLNHYETPSDFQRQFEEHLRDRLEQWLEQHVAPGKQHLSARAAQDLSEAIEVTQSSVKSGPLRVFISYSHEDGRQKDEVVTCLRALPPRIEIEPWDDTRMLAGSKIDQRIFGEIKKSDVFLALISRHYLASDYCRAEMTDALEHAQKRGLTVVPVIVRKTDSWREYPIGQHLALPPDGKAPTDWAHEDEHWAAVERGLKNLLKAKGGGPANFEPPREQAPASGGSIQQEPIELVEDGEFCSQLKLELTRALSHVQLGPLVAALLPLVEDIKPAAAADSLLKLEPLDSIRALTSAAFSWFRTLSPHEQTAVWDSVKNVHLRLLPRLVDPEWIKRWAQDANVQGDRRLFTVSIKPKSRNRSVEILVARLDAKRGMVRFDPEPELPHLSAPSGQINTGHQALRDLQKPTADEVVQRIGRYLLTRFDPDELPPEILEQEHWLELNDHLIERPVGGRHYYYLVMSDDDPEFANEPVLRLLYQNLPNLPRVLLSAKIGTAYPLLYRQAQLEAVIEAFWDLEPTVKE